MLEKRKGFTLIEVLIVVAIIAVIGIVTYVNLGGNQNQTALTSTAQQATAVIRQAQVSASSQKQDTVWGVYFSNSASNPFYALISSSTYSNSTVVQTYPLPAGVAYVTSTLPIGSALTVAFSPISGNSIASTSVSIYSTQQPSLVETISVNGIGQVSYSSGASGSSQNIWVADENGQHIDELNSSGVYQLQIGICATGPCNSTTTIGGFQYPYAVAIDSNGNIWVADSQNNRVEKFNSSGVYQSEIGLGCGAAAVQNYGDACTPTSTNGGFQYPWGVAIDSSGNIWVADQDNNRVEKFNSSGAYQSQLGCGGSGGCAATSTAGMFNYPYGIAVDSSGNIWVVDARNNRVEKFNSSGVYQSEIGLSCGVGGCAATSTNGGFSGPAGLAVDSSGNIWVTDTGNNRVEEFNSSGVYQSEIGIYNPATGIWVASSLPGGFYAPLGIAIDSSGNIWVVDSRNYRIDEFNSAGTYLGLPTSTTGAFDYPTGIAVH